MSASSRNSVAFSLLAHVAFIALLLIIGAARSPLTNRPNRPRDFVRLLSPWRPARTGTTGHGGGGQRSPTPATKGRLPQFARRQLTPPMVVPQNIEPKLVVPPTLLVNARIHVPDLPLTIGDPHGINGPPSGGPGSGGGIGDGVGTGIGRDRGPSWGNGLGPGAGTSSGMLTKPVLIYKIDPDYSDQARTARLQGMITVRLDIGPDGRPQNVRIDQGLGLGLDEKAIEAVRQWRFRPGTRNGKPVISSALVEVQFRLL